MTAKKPTLVYVEWADAHADSTWAHVDEINDDGEYLVRSVGWLLEPASGGKQGHLSLCQSLTVDHFIDHVIHIPIAMVRKTTKLKLRN